MLNINFPKIDKKTFNDLEISLAEEKIKINIRGKSKDFFTKVGKITSIILPTEANTSSSNEKFNALWLSTDDWMIYFVVKYRNNVINIVTKNSNRFLIVFRIYYCIWFI